MNLEADIEWIHQELDTVKDPILIEAFKNMLKYRTQHNTEVKQYNNELNEAENDIETGNYYTIEEVKKIASQWKK